VSLFGQGRGSSGQTQTSEITPAWRQTTGVGGGVLPRLAR
jgi:hypothetical protein